MVVAPFHRFSTLFVSNVYLLDGGPGDRWLIDSGHWSERLQLVRELRATGLQPSEINGVLLTHRHSDHAGNAAFLQREYGLKVLCHRADAAVLDGSSPRPVMGARGSALERALCALENRFPARLYVDRALDDGDTAASLEVHHVSGHTEGSVFYRHATTGCLLTGDTLLTARPPLTLVRDVMRAHDAFSLDTERAHAALDAFHAAGWRYDHVLAGHGKPLVGDGRARVMRALARSRRSGR
jgi:glyoxylase-like metal-dependent hydrolase (beta-lactamase superfamily II)